MLQCAKISLEISFIIVLRGLVLYLFSIIEKLGRVKQMTFFIIELLTNKRKFKSTNFSMIKSQLSLINCHVTCRP